MNVLCTGFPFNCAYDPLTLYEGPHDIRLLDVAPEADFSYDPIHETIADVVSRIKSEWKPDLLIAWFPEKRPPPRGIEACPIPTVATVSDWDVHYPELAVNLARYDAVLSDQGGLDVLRNELVTPHRLFPLYSQLTTMHKPWPGEKDIDVLFAGSMNHARHAQRGRVLEKLARLSDRYRVVLAEGFHGEAYGRLLSRARIVFNYAIRGELNLRVFETFACDSLLFLESSNIEAREYFEDGRELVFYTWDTMEERLAHYLDRPGEARAIAAQGHQRAPEFAGENRFDRLIEWAAAQPSSGRRFHELPRVEQDYQSVLMYRFKDLPQFHAVEAALVDALLQQAPHDPRMWACVGNHLVNPMNGPGDPGRQKALYVKAFEQAHRLDPVSGPHAMNASTAYYMSGDKAAEKRCLEAAVRAESPAGEDLLIERHFHPFWPRWQRAMAEQRHSLDMLKAEAHIQLASLAAEEPGRIRDAEAHLAQAAELDPANAGGVELLSRIQWLTGRKEQAAGFLAGRLKDLPFDYRARAWLEEMYTALGRTTEAEALARETALLRMACEPPPMPGENDRGRPQAPS